jgi:nitroreductase/NAD-dependent dihydropyrimidine dehydrogenase PreA subunit
MKTERKTRDTNSPIRIQISEVCIFCGACSEVCPMGVLGVEKETPSPKAPVITDSSACILCGQCISVCPKDAIANSHLALDDFPIIEAAPNIEWNQFVALTRQRRSTRSFTDNHVPREIIEKILDESTRYAPTGHNRQATEIRIIQGEDLEKLRDGMNAVILRLERVLRYLHWVSAYLDSQWQMLRPFAHMIESGLDPSTRGAPLLLLFFADDRIKESEIDAAIWSYQTLLSAEVLGIGSCYLGALVNALPYSRFLRSLISTSVHRRLVCGLLLGYSKAKYKRLVPRAPIGILS